MRREVRVQPLPLGAGALLQGVPAGALWPEAGGCAGSPLTPGSALTATRRTTRRRYIVFLPALHACSCGNFAWIYEQA